MTAHSHQLGSCRCSRGAANTNIQRAVSERGKPNDPLESAGLRKVLIAFANLKNSEEAESRVATMRAARPLVLHRVSHYARALLALVLIIFIKNIFSLTTEYD